MSALEAAVSVLRRYSSTRTELTVTEVAQMLSLPKSNVSRLLRSMRDVGLLERIRRVRANTSFEMHGQGPWSTITMSR